VQGNDDEATAVFFGRQIEESQVQFMDLLEE
jgi:hypothetical protein